MENHASVAKNWFAGKRLNRFGENRKGHNMFCDLDGIYSFGYHFPLVRECANGYILNGETYSSSTTGHQGTVRWAVPKDKIKCIIPYRVLAESGCIGSRSNDVVGFKTIRIEDVCEDQWREVEYKDDKGETKTRSEHLLGGSLIKVGSRYFISSTDTSAHWRRGYFLTELVKPCKTFADGLASLKPDVVKEAEDKQIKVVRQGEWYFIRVSDSPWKMFRKSLSLLPNIQLKDYLLKGKLLPVLDHQRVPHHSVRDLVEFGGQRYVRGSVKHNQGDHRRLLLGEDWFMAVHNHQVNSWSISGNVD